MSAVIVIDDGIINTDRTGLGQRTTSDAVLPRSFHGYRRSSSSSHFQLADVWACRLRLPRSCRRWFHSSATQRPPVRSLAGSGHDGAMIASGARSAAPLDRYDTLPIVRGRRPVSHR